MTGTCKVLVSTHKITFIFKSTRVQVWLQVRLNTEYPRVPQKLVQEYRSTEYFGPKLHIKSKTHNINSNGYIGMNLFKIILMLPGYSTVAYQILDTLWMSRKQIYCE